MTSSDAVASALAALIAALQATQVTPSEPAPQQMLTVVEAAEYLRCSESLIYAMLADGRLRGARVGRRRLISMSEIRRITLGDEP